MRDRRVGTEVRVSLSLGASAGRWQPGLTAQLCCPSPRPCQRLGLCRAAVPVARSSPSCVSPLAPLRCSGFNLCPVVSVSRGSGVCTAVLLSPCPLAW